MITNNKLKVQILSDTHNEAPECVLDHTADLIIHAGDFGNHGLYHVQKYIKYCKDHKLDFLFVLGNHDYYGSYIDSVVDLLRKDNAMFLYGSNEIKWKGYTFIGGTMWSNFRANKVQYNDPLLFDKYKNDCRAMIDFHSIGPHTRLVNKFVTPEDYVTFNNAEWNFLQKYKNKEDVIVVTHFPISLACLDPYWSTHPTGKIYNPYFINDRDLTGFSLAISGHCVDMETEILTTNGWKFRNELTVSDTIYTYNPNKDFLEVKPILKITDMDYTGDVYHFKGKSISQRVTDKHRMVGFTDKGYVETTAEGLSKRKSTFSFLHSSVLSLIGIDLTDDMLRLFICITADGSLCNTNLIRFSLNKERKKTYIKNLLDNLGIEYRVYDYTDYGGGRSSINFTLPEELSDWNLKGLDNKLLNCNRHQVGIIYEAYSQTDGYYKGKCLCITTAKKSEFDILSHIMTINGYKVSHNFRIHGFSKTGCYELTISDKKLQGFSKPSQSYTKTFVKNEHFWCVTVENENFFMRRDGKISLTGNTHTAVDTVVDGCRVIVNPLGHVNEQRKGNGYRDYLTIELENKEI